TQMLIAGDATITGEMIVNELVGKILRGGMIDGGEVWMRGQAAGSSQVQYAEQFTSAASGNYSAQVNGWQANHSTGTGWTPSTGLSIASGGQSGNCLKVAALSMPGTGSGAIVRSANSNMFSAVTTNGTKRVEAYIKAGAKTKVRLGAYVKYPGIDTTNSVWTDTVVITANTWTKMTVDVPVGFIITGVIFSLNDATDSTAIVSRDVFVDTVTVTTTFDLASNIRLYQTPDGYPTLDLTDANGLIRARLSSGKDNFTGLSFFSNDGDAMTFTGGGLYMTKAGPGQTPVHLLTWPSLIESANRESYTRSGAADVPAINGNGWALVTVNYSSPITAGISYRADATLVGADGTADRCTVSCTFLGVSSALFRVRNVTTGATGTGFRLHWKIERGGDE
ncbi:MAG: hypothetical protein L0K43_09575, partial [Bifidobacterium crudilactis]|nr:hypothetical protein [Bifidobacterium crudilactis]